jgi:hypothetical protein
MNKETKEVLDTLEKIYKRPVPFMLTSEERWKALDKIMTTYARNRSKILQEQTDGNEVK